MQYQQDGALLITVIRREIYHGIPQTAARYLAFCEEASLRTIFVELHGTSTDVRENLKNRFFPNFSTVSNIDPVIVVRR